jgi:uncharacterized SAM-binding protein YcdF (DUF218 family)
MIEVAQSEVLFAVIKSNLFSNFLFSFFAFLASSFAVLCLAFSSFLVLVIVKDLINQSIKQASKQSINQSTDVIDIVFID